MAAAVRRGGVAGRDGRLQLVRPGPLLAQRGLEYGDALVDLGPVPQRTVLVLQRYHVTRPIQPGARRASCKSIKASSPQSLRLVGHQGGEGPG